MPNDAPAYVCLVEGLHRVLDAYLTSIASPPAETRRRQRGLNLRPEPAQILRTALRQHFPDWRDVAAAAATANGREDSDVNDLDAHRDWAVASELLGLLSLGSVPHDTAAIAHRAAACLAGRPLPLWEYVAVDIPVPVTTMPLVEGWELCSADRRADPMLPVEFPGLPSDLWSPDALHSGGYGALRRPLGSRRLCETPRGEADLLWPLMALNLVGPTPVRGFTAYLVEPGRQVVVQREPDVPYLPAELFNWHPKPLSRRPYRAKTFDTSTITDFSRYATEIGACMAGLGTADRRQFGCAAAHHLYLVYQQDRWAAELDGSYVAFRRTVTIEALLTGTDSDHESLSRKVAQRGALLLGTDDDARLAALHLIRAAYTARSAFAHGSGKTKPVDQPALANATQTLVRRWLALAAIHGGKRLADLLDEALLSTGVRDALLGTIAEHERRATIA